MKKIRSFNPNTPHTRPFLSLVFLLGWVSACQMGFAKNSEQAQSAETGLLETRVIDIKQAIQPITEEIRRNPKSPMAYCKRARKYTQLGRYKEAIKDYSKAIELNQNSSGGPDFAYQMRGYCKVQVGDFKGSIADFSQVLSRNAKSGPALYNRAAAYEKIGRNDLAKLDRMTLSKIHFSPESCQQISYARYLMHNGQYTQALAVYERKIKEEPNNSFAYMGRAQCYHKLNQPAKALEDIKKLESMQKSFAPCTVLKATILLESEKFDECIDACTKELESRPNNAALHILNAKAHKAKGDFSKAIVDYTNAMNIDPSNTENYLARAQLHEKLGDMKRALKDCSQFVSLNPRDSSALCTRALLYRKLKENEKALEDLNNAIRISPKDEFLYTKRAEIYYSKRLFSEALKDYEKAKELDPANHKYYESYSKKIREEVSSNISK
jgi:tetratricopeptide (TPR) repeat protein